MTRGELRDYYDKPLEHPDNRGPYWTYDGSLEYEGHLTKFVHWLFEATLDGRHKVIVKFVREHYDAAVHKFLAAKCCAPELHCCQLLPGGWHAVVMDKLKGCSITLDNSDTVKQSLWEAVEKCTRHGMYLAIYTLKTYHL